MHQSIPQTPTHLRVFIACLLSLLTLLAPVASVAAATLRATEPLPATNKKQLSAEEKLDSYLFEPAAPPVPGITATKVDTFPSHPSGQANPGDTITYDVNVQNSGTDATGVQFTDTIDPNTTLVPGSLRVSPLAFADTYSTSKDTPLSVPAPGVLANDTGLPVPTAVPIADGPTTGGGTITLSANGSFTYTPLTGFTGPDAFTYTATNGLLPNDTAVVTINVDSPPVAVNDAATVGEDSGATAVDVLFNDTDTDGGPKNIASATQPANGVVVLTGGSPGAFTGLTYQPNANYCNNPPGSTLDTFTYTLNGGSVGTVSMTVSCVNDPPSFTRGPNQVVAEDAGPQTVPNWATAISAGPPDESSQTLTFVVTGNSNPGLFSAAPAVSSTGTLTFTPAANAFGATTIMLKLTDDGGGTNESPTLSFNINILPVDDAPIVDLNGAGAGIDTSASFTEDAGAITIAPGALANDVDDINLESATITLTNRPDGVAESLAVNVAGTSIIAAAYDSATGVLALSGTDTLAHYQQVLRTVTYNNTSNNPTTTSRSVTFKVNDGDVDATVATAAVSVTAVNDGPVVDLNGGAAGINTAATFTEDGAAITLAGATDVSDVDNANLQSATITLTNRPDGAAESLSVDTTGTTIVAAAYVPGTGVLALSGIDTLAHYQQVLRTVKYDNTDQDPDTTARLVNFVANDGSIDSATAVATVTVVAVNDAPVLGGVAGGFTYTENDAATAIAAALTVTDVDSATLTQAIVTISSNFQSGQDVLSFTNDGSTMGNIAVGSNVGGVLTLNSAGGTATLAQWQSALRAVKYSNTSDEPNTSVRTVTFQANDGGAVNNLSNTVTRTISVTSVNDPPTAFGFLAQTAQAGIPITYPAGKLGGTDLEAGTTITIDTTPINVTNGTVTINANGSFTFTPLPGSVGINTASFQYRVSDNGNPGPGVSGLYSTVSFTVAGPAIYFVKSAALGSGNCTLGNECLLATAVANIGASTNARIFLEDANNHAGAVPLNSGGWLIGQGVTGITFDALFGINAPAQGVLAARPSLGLARPTAQITVTLNTNSSVQGLNISSTGATGMSDTGAAITGVTVSEVSVTTTTGTAVSLSDIAGTISFTSVSANGAANGISLTNSTGSFTVTGNGGVCTLATPTCTGGAIQNTAGADGTTTGRGVSMVNAANVSLSLMHLNNNKNFAVYGNNVSGFTLTNSFIHGINGTNAAVGTEDGSVSFDNLLGSASISGCDIDGAKTNNIRVVNTSGTLNSLTISNTTIRLLDPAVGNDALHFEGFNAGTVMNLTVSGGTFLGARGDIIDTIAQTGVTQDIVIRGNSFTNQQAGVVSGNTAIIVQGTGTVTYDVSCNKVQQLNAAGTLGTAQGHGINIAKSTAGGNFSGTVFNNSIGTPGIQRSGAGDAGNGINFIANGAGAHTSLIKNNVINNYGEAGIRVIGNNGNSTANVTIIGNITTEPNPTFGFAGLFVDVGAFAADTNTFNVKVGGAGAEQNDFTAGTPFDPGDISLNNTAATVNTHLNLTRPPSASNVVDIVLQDNNTGTPSISNSGTITLVNTLPTLPAAITETCTPPPLLFADGGIESVLDSSSLLARFMNASLLTPPCVRPETVVSSLGQDQLDSIIAAAIARWAATGLTLQQLSTLSAIKFAVADLDRGYLGEAANDRVLIDRNAGGKGWYLSADRQSDSLFSQTVSITRRNTDPMSAPAGHLDLLTAIEHEMGHKLGLSDSYAEKDRDSLMYGYLTVGERRSPFAHQAAGAQPNTSVGPQHLTSSGTAPEGNSISKSRAPAASARANTNAARLSSAAPLSGETVNATIGTLPGGKTVHIQFQVTINNPLPIGTTQVSNQGTVTFNEVGSPVLTDDPAVGGASDPTLTPVQAQLALIVNTLGDAPDANVGDGSCDTDAGTAGEQCTLRAAIQETNSSLSDDSFGFDPALNGGTITLDTALDAINGNLIITGPGATLLTVRRSSASGTPDFRIFTINSGQTVTISGLTIGNGNAVGGPGANAGGGISNSGTLTLSNNVISGNNASAAGGGVANAGTLTVNSSTVSGNTAPSGGGIYSSVITSGTVAVTINNSTISGNNSSSLGAGIFSGAGSGTSVANLTINNSTISGNINAGSSGGGIYNAAVFGNALATLTISNSTISGNSAGSGGGIFHLSSGTGSTANASLVNTTITGNNSGLATDSGGGIRSSAESGGSTSLALRNTIVAGNLRSAGTVPSDVSGAVEPTSSFNLIGDGTDMTGISNGLGGNQVGSSGSPINPRLAALANNGGPTQTHALLAGSPALDAGDNCVFDNTCAPAYGFSLTTDQRGPGFTRKADAADADTIQVVDIGAFEADPSVEDISDKTTNEDTDLPTFNFNVGDAATAFDSITATSGNTTLVPNANLTVGADTPSTRTLSISPAANEFGTATITVTVTKTINTTAVSMSDTFVLTVNAVNDVPSFTKGPDQNVAEDSGAISVPGWATAISAGPANESGQTLTFLVVGNTNSSLFSAQPAISSTGTLTYTPAANTSGSATITIALMDNGGTLNGGVDTSATQTFTITVNSINDAPVNTVPGAQNVVENSTLTFSAANSNPISIADADAGSNAVRVQLTAVNGTITLSGIGGLSFTVGDGSADPTMTFTGTIASINNALNGMVFTPTAGFDGAASLQIVTNDQGNTGSGGALSDTDSVSITVLDGGTLQFSAPTYSVSENVVNATITVTRTGGTAGTATVQFATSNGTATAADYTSVTQTVTFNNGDTSKTVAVPINDDLLDENNETVNLTLSSVGGSGTLGAPATAVLTINDDDPTPSLSINDVSLAEGDSGTVTFTFTITLSGASGLPVTVNYATANGTATAPSDYLAVPSTLVTFNPGETTKTVNVTVNGDILSEGNETFFVNLTTPSNATIADNQGLGTILDDDAIGGLITFSSATYTIAEDDGSVQITVNRNGTTTQAVTVDYATADMTATERKDYTTALGTLKFAAGETTKTFTVLVNVDSFVEGSELVALTLSNPTGGATLGVPQNATLLINDVLWIGPPANPVDEAQFFVRQHYHDFLNREPDAPGLAFWTNEITSCGSDGTCIEIRRINVSAAFFLSIEFQETGFTAYLANRAAFGAPLPRYSRFERDTQALQRGFIFTAPGSAAVLEANKVAFFDELVTRPEFIALYGGLSNDQYVDALIVNTGVTFTQAERDALVNGLNGATETRATVLRKVSEKQSFKQAEFNRAFVMMQYFGYLRRNPDDAPDNNLNGFNFWLNKLNAFNGNFVDAEMVKAFISSTEYRQRFGN